MDPKQHRLANYLYREHLNSLLKQNLPARYIYLGKTLKSQSRGKMMATCWLTTAALQITPKFSHLHPQIFNYLSVSSDWEFQSSLAVPAWGIS